jgi:hypothetical protein
MPERIRARIAIDRGILSPADADGVQNDEESAGHGGDPCG